MEKTSEFLIYLMACSLQGTKPEEALLANIDMEALLRLAKAHSVSAMVCMALEQTDAFHREDGKLESMVQRVYRQIKAVDTDATVTIATSKSQVSAIHNQLGEEVGISVEPCRRDGLLFISIMVTTLVIGLNAVAPVYKNISYLLPPCRIKKNIVIRHFAHSEFRIPVFQNAAFQRHIPDTMLCKFFFQSVPFGIQKHIFADSLVFAIQPFQPGGFSGVLEDLDELLGTNIIGKRPQTLAGTAGQ